MNKNIIITILGIVAIVIAILLSDKKETVPATDTGRIVAPGEVQPEDDASTPTKTVSGVILEKDDGCFADGICKINVTGTWVITNRGWYQGPLGSVADNLAVGMRVEAYGKVTEDGGITMLGSDSYYVKVK